MAAAKIDYEKFQASLKRLIEQHENYKTLDASAPRLTQEAVAESTIQRFEVCFDSTWKILKKYLINVLGIPEVPNSPKPVLRTAHENNLMDSPIDRWMDYSDKRRDTSHDYSAAKAQACLNIVGGFIEDAIALYETMSKKKWQ